MPKCACGYCGRYENLDIFMRYDYCHVCTTYFKSFFFPLLTDGIQILLRFGTSLRPALPTQRHRRTVKLNTYHTSFWEHPKKCYFFPIIPFFLVFPPKPLFLYNKWCPFSPMSSSIPAVLWDHFFCCALPTTAKDDDWKKGAHHPKINGLFSLLSSVYPIKSVFLPNKNSFWIIFFVVVVRP